MSGLSRTNTILHCSSCSLYYRKRGVKRPLYLCNREIHKRKRLSAHALSENRLEVDVAKMIHAMGKGEDGSRGLANEENAPPIPSSLSPVSSHIDASLVQ